MKIHSLNKLMQEKSRVEKKQFKKILVAKSTKNHNAFRHYKCLNRQLFPRKQLPRANCGQKASLEEYTGNVEAAMLEWYCKGRREKIEFGDDSTLDLGLSNVNDELDAFVNKSLVASPCRKLVSSFGDAVNILRPAVGNLE